ncbi:hypothetical protein DR864_00440 [Runella rosea]|uniref:Uncharacterized protein n=1 Tax=Runella rosea TaxID=2259595 RepID=A0A344TCD0_9BACT|nr:hypothetical protein [Runella rosea]AXE16246.1 hypothetical protein DR864_00165 [Runella rosea]AXE16301.1 hypothetical protein DR864_00440 [Runella rosea]
MSQIRGEASLLRIFLSNFQNRFSHEKDLDIHRPRPDFTGWLNTVLLITFHDLAFKTMQKPLMNDDDVWGVFLTGILCALGSAAIVGAVLYCGSQLIAFLTR